MSIFVDPNQTFPIKIKFKEEYDDNGIEAGVRVFSPETEGEDIQELVCHAVGRDFDNMSRILEEATVINHINGKPMLRASVLCRKIVLVFFRSWNFLDDATGQPIPLNVDSVSRLHHTVVTGLARRWLLKTSGRKGE